jgi:hypothetical protein
VSKHGSGALRWQAKARRLHEHRRRSRMESTSQQAGPCTRTLGVGLRARQAGIQVVVPMASGLRSAVRSILSGESPLLPWPIAVRQAGTQTTIESGRPVPASRNGVPAYANRAQTHLSRNRWQANDCETGPKRGAMCQQADPRSLPSTALHPGPGRWRVSSLKHESPPDESGGT